MILRMQKETRVCEGDEMKIDVEQVREKIPTNLKYNE